MEQHHVVNKAFLTLKMAGLVNPIYADEIKTILNQVWVAGWENRGKQLTAHNKKQVAQYNSDNNLISTYDSVKQASKVTKYKTGVIYESIWYNRMTRAKHYWRYINNEVPEYK